MKATIWHNRRCSKSRETLALLNAAGADVEVIDYLANPPSRDRLAQLYAEARLTPRQGLRKDAKAESDEAALDLMVADPATIERPLVQTAKGVRLCRPPETVHEIL
ncbi:MAG TPA: ArsC/Spx/MgsR family protein [Sphingomonas sp.]|nr:ArsC/Spx/MgsR family protein [Sphingomonas sp.]